LSLVFFWVWRVCFFHLLIKSLNNLVLICLKTRFNNDSNCLSLLSLFNNFLKCLKIGLVAIFLNWLKTFWELSTFFTCWGAFPFHLLKYSLNESFNLRSYKFLHIFKYNFFSKSFFDKLLACNNQFLRTLFKFLSEFKLFFCSKILSNFLKNLFTNSGFLICFNLSKKSSP
jgi:hypothetical protein